MQKHITLALLFAGLFSLFLVSCSQGQDKPKTSSQSQVYLDPPQKFQTAMAQTENPQLIDVRTPGEYSSGHLKGFRNVDFYQKDFRSNMEKLDKEKPVFVYCAVGGRSGEAAGMLKNMGFKEIHDLKGGIQAWAREALPVE